MRSSGSDQFFSLDKSRLEKDAVQHDVVSLLRVLFFRAVSNLRRKQLVHNVAIQFADR